MYQEYFSIQLSSTICLGIPLEHMGAVVQLEIDKICPVPGVGEHWHGVVNYKGSLLWVLDSDRYFQLNNDRNVLERKLTAVIIKQQPGKTTKRIALIVQKLVGIESLEIGDLTLQANITPQLKECCVQSSIVEDKSTYILNPSSLLQQLQQFALAAA